MAFVFELPRLIDFIIMDPQLMASIRKMTNTSVRDEALVNNIKTVIAESLKVGTSGRVAERPRKGLCIGLWATVCWLRQRRAWST